MDGRKHLRLFGLGQTHYGGLRSELRRLTDSELATDEKTRTILEEKEIWYRYVPSNSSPDMSDVVWFFMTTYFPEGTKTQHSGRYKKIYIKESEPDKLIWVP
jgi:outer membrane lipoprotein-sorting protein